MALKKSCCTSWLEIRFKPEKQNGKLRKFYSIKEHKEEI